MDFRVTQKNMAIFTVLCGFGLLGFLKFISIPDDHNLAWLKYTKFLIGASETVAITLLAVGLVDLVKTFITFKEDESLISFLKNNCMNENCWTGIQNCKQIKKDSKSIAVVHPSRDTLADKYPLLLNFENVDTVGFGQSRLVKVFHESYPENRKELIKRLIAKKSNIRILAPAVNEKYFNVKDNDLARRQSLLEEGDPEIEPNKIKKLIEWYVLFIRDLVEHLVNNNTKKGDEVIDRIELRLHHVEVTPFYLRLYQQGEGKIHFGPYLPETVSSAILTFELPIAAHKDDISRSVSQLTGYFDTAWNEASKEGGKLAHEYYAYTLNLNAEEKKLPVNERWNRFLDETRN